MNDEIKEILDYLKIENGHCSSELSYEETHLLLDCITNLQQQLHQASLDIQELTERDIECPSWCDKLTNLQQENEQLITELNSYKSRIEKAVEYIESRAKMAREEELLNILNGKE